VAGDVPADARGGDAGLAVGHRDDGVVDVGRGDLPCPEDKQQVDEFAGTAAGRLRLGGGGPPARTACQALGAWPGTGSAGLVKAVPVLRAGTSSRQAASRARTWPESPAISVPSCCQRTQPTRSPAISSLRWPENSQASVTARTSSRG
jgi:hypothetical protein